MSQNYKNHTRIVPVFHYAGYLLTLGVLGVSMWNMQRAIKGRTDIYDASILFAISLVLLILMFYSREFGLKAQDRAIRAEENFRHYILTGRPFDSSLTRTQIIALRFASDAEMPALAVRAVSEKLSSKDIKKSIVNWRADYHRV
jgi:NADH:ubiquinone oxidoreductase subunit 6 (subunit J)